TWDLLRFFFLVCRLPRSTLFPYTTLFRSSGRGAGWVRGVCVAAPLGVPGRSQMPTGRSGRDDDRERGEEHEPGDGRDDGRRRARSEEHTSELQSRFDLVCRLLLEKKNKPI